MVILRQFPYNSVHEVWVGVIYFMTPSSLKPKREAGVFFLGSIAFTCQLHCPYQSLHSALGSLEA